MSLRRQFKRIRKETHLISLQGGQIPATHIVMQETLRHVGQRERPGMRLGMQAYDFFFFFFDDDKSERTFPIVRLGPQHTIRN